MMKVSFLGACAGLLVVVCLRERGTDGVVLGFWEGTRRDVICDLAAALQKGLALKCLEEP